MIDPAPCHVGDVQQPVDAAQVDKRAVVGDVLDQAVDDLTLGEARDDFGALLGAALFEDGTARDDDVTAAAIHFQNLERLLLVHQRPDIAHGTDVDLRTGKERHGPIEIDGEAALDLVEDDAGDFLALLVKALEACPAFLSPRLIARQNGFTERVLDALQVDLDGVADLETARLAVEAEFLHRDAAFHFEADVDDCHVLFNADNLALDDGAFEQVVLGKAFGQQRGKIFARGIHLS